MEQDQEVKPIDYTDEEKSYRNELIRKLQRARDERESPHAQFDGMTYSEYYDFNEKADQSYIPPKRNKEDKRIVTGLTHEKDSTLLSTLLNFNLQADIKAFDENDIEINEIGESMEDMERKSRRMEDYDLKRPLIYRELLAQGTVFVEEMWREQFSPVKPINGELPADMAINQITWTERIKQTYAGAEVNLLKGTKVYLGDIRQFFMALQPYVFTKEVVSYDRAKTIYGEWERWKHVPRKIQRATPETNDDGTTTFGDWSLGDMQKDQVEVIKFQDKWSNEYQIMLNGVMMLPIKFPLTAISPSGEYTITKGDLDPRPHFAYSKSIPAKTKVDQAVLDEFLKLMILKTQQSFKPPMANNTKRVLSKNIFLPATITNDIREGTLTPLIETRGVTPAEFSMYQLIKEQIDNKTVTPAFAGETQTGQQTATEILENKKQQMLKLGLTLDGVLNLERQMSWMRIYTIIDKWTLPMDKRVDQTRENLVDVYRTISIDGDFENGQRGTKRIKFTIDTNVSSDDLHSREVAEGKQGHEIREVLINPQGLRQLKAKWFIQMVPTEKNGDTLARILFVQNIQEAIAIFGPESLNMDYLKQRFATIISEDASKMFNDDVVVKQLLQNRQEEAARGQPQRGSRLSSIQPREPRLQAVLNN